MVRQRGGRPGPRRRRRRRRRTSTVRRATPAHDKHDPSLFGQRLEPARARSEELSSCSRSPGDNSQRGLTGAAVDEPAPKNWRPEGAPGMVMGLVESDAPETVTWKSSPWLVKP